MHLHGLIGPTAQVSQPPSSNFGKKLFKENMQAEIFRHTSDRNRKHTVVLK
jgi:hypothetical protein